MFEAFKQKVRMRNYFHGFTRAIEMVLGLGDTAKEGEIDVLIIPLSTLRALTEREKERYRAQEDK